MSATKTRPRPKSKAKTAEAPPAPAREPVSREDAAALLALLSHEQLDDRRREALLKRDLYRASGQRQLAIEADLLAEGFAFLMGRYWELHKLIHGVDKAKG